MSTAEFSHKAFFGQLKKYYTFYTVGFLGFLFALAIAEQMGMSRQWIGYWFLFATIGLYASIGVMSRTVDAAEYYVAGRRVPAFFNGMATGADWMSAASFIGMAGTLYLSGFDGLASLILSAFTKEMTWLEASTRHSLDELIDTFYATRVNTHDALNDLTDEQVSYASNVHPFWTISESISHLVYTQGFYHNKLLDISTSQLPHVVEAARGFGEGAKKNISVRDLLVSLNTATERIQVIVEQTRNSHDPEKTERSPTFGLCNYKTWILLLLAHEVDHLRQIAAMRKVSMTGE